MLANALSCRLYDEYPDTGIPPSHKRNTRKLFIAETCIPAESTEVSMEASVGNTFCPFHPSSFLELRFTDQFETYRGCPECEKEAFFKDHKMSVAEARAL